ncbi:MAG TPA: hypothetical protein VIU33_08425 [Nitrospiria bacterium]
MVTDDEGIVVVTGLTSVVVLDNGLVVVVENVVVLVVVLGMRLNMGVQSFPASIVSFASRQSGSPLHPEKTDPPEGTGVMATRVPLEYNLHFIYIAKQTVGDPGGFKSTVPLPVPKGRSIVKTKLGGGDVVLVEKVVEVVVVDTAVVLVELVVVVVTPVVEVVDVVVVLVAPVVVVVDVVEIVVTVPKP